jgi:hypothetical protein
MEKLKNAKNAKIRAIHPNPTIVGFTNRRISPFGRLRPPPPPPYAGAEKSGKAHFSAQLIFLPSFRWAGLPR